MIDDLGLTERSGFDNKQPPRKETNEKSQRPVEQTKTVKDSRGTFKDKC